MERSSIQLWQRLGVSVFVTNVSKKIYHSSLKATFQVYGKVVDTFITYNNLRRRYKDTTFAFVRFKEDAGARQGEDGVSHDALYHDPRNCPQPHAEIIPNTRFINESVEREDSSDRFDVDNHASHLSQSVSSDTSNTGLLDVPISVEPTFQVCKEERASEKVDDVGPDVRDLDGQSISNESRLQEVQVDQLEDRVQDVYLKVGQGTGLILAGQNMSMPSGLRAGIDRLQWWAGAIRDKRNHGKGPTIYKLVNKMNRKKGVTHKEHRGAEPKNVNSSSPRSGSQLGRMEALVTLELGKKICGWVSMCLMQLW
ncbi:hypothetical protein V6N13_061135 [Hibiscus sabdariffa]